jgi:hypothetical protein
MDKIEVRRRILDIVTAMPGCEYKEILTLADAKAYTVKEQLRILANDGTLTKEKKTFNTKQRGGRTFALTYSLREPGTKVVSAAPVTVRKAQTLSDTSTLLEVLHAEIAELKAWKVDAIARYPDLGVEPLILKARKIVANIYHKKLDTTRKADALAGRLDKTPIMEATVAALELTV